MRERVAARALVEGRALETQNYFDIASLSAAYPYVAHCATTAADSFAGSYGMTLCTNAGGARTALTAPAHVQFGRHAQH